jgi:hypothetical protein
MRKVDFNEGGFIVYQHRTDEALAQIREGLKKFEAVEKNLTRNNQKILGYDQDLPATMEILLESLALSTLFNTIPELPLFTPEIADLTPEKMREESDAARAYQLEAKRVLSNTQWRNDINSIVADSVVLGEGAKGYSSGRPPQHRPARFAVLHDR